MTAQTADPWTPHNRTHEEQLRLMAGSRWFNEMANSDDVAACLAGADALARVAALEAALWEVVNAYDTYRARGVIPAPEAYQRIVQAVNDARAALVDSPGGTR